MLESIEIHIIIAREWVDCWSFVVKKNMSADHIFQQYTASASDYVPQMQLFEEGIQLKQETLRVVTIAMICSPMAWLWKFQYFWGLYLTQSNIYDGAFIAKIVSRKVYSQMFA